MTPFRYFLKYLLLTFCTPAFHIRENLIIFHQSDKTYQIKNLIVEEDIYTTSSLNTDFIFYN